MYVHKPSVSTIQTCTQTCGETKMVLLNTITGKDTQTNTNTSQNAHTTHTTTNTNPNKTHTYYKNHTHKTGRTQRSVSGLDGCSGTIWCGGAREVGMGVSIWSRRGHISHVWRGGDTKRKNNTTKYGGRTKEKKKNNKDVLIGRLPKELYIQWQTQR